MLKIILVRHGETEWNRIHRLQGGDSDIPLNEEGRAQAENLALRLKDEKLEAIYSSPLQRALDTAWAIARYHQVKVNIAPSLKEIHVGELEGADSLTMKLRWDQLLCQDNESEASLRGVESICAVRDRSCALVNDLAAKYQEGSVVVVSHYVVIMALVCAVLELPLEHIVHLKLNPGSISAFQINKDGTARLELFNDCCRIER